MLPSHDNYYNINYLFYRDAFVLGHVTSALADVLPMNEIHPLKVRSVRMPRTKSSWIPTKALILDSGVNIHIINNPNLLSCIRLYIGQYINTTGSHTVCNKWDGYAKHSSLYLFLLLNISINLTVLGISLAYPCYLTLI